MKKIFILLLFCFISFESFGGGYNYCQMSLSSSSVGAWTVVVFGDKYWYGNGNGLANDYVNSSYHGSTHIGGSVVIDGITYSISTEKHISAYTWGPNTITINDSDIYNWTPPPEPVIATNSFDRYNVEISNPTDQPIEFGYTTYDSSGNIIQDVNNVLSAESGYGVYSIDIPTDAAWWVLNVLETEYPGGFPDEYIGQINYQGTYSFVSEDETIVSEEFDIGAPSSTTNNTVSGAFEAASGNAETVAEIKALRSDIGTGLDGVVGSVDELKIANNQGFASLNDTLTTGSSISFDGNETIEDPDSQIALDSALNAYSGVVSDNVTEGDEQQTFLDNWLSGFFQIQLPASVGKTEFLDIDFPSISLLDGWSSVRLGVAGGMPSVVYNFMEYALYGWGLFVCLGMLHRTFGGG